MTSGRRRSTRTYNLDIINTMEAQQRAIYLVFVCNINENDVCYTFSLSFSRSFFFALLFVSFVLFHRSIGLMTFYRFARAPYADRIQRQEHVSIVLSTCTLPIYLCVLFFSLLFFYFFFFVCALKNERDGAREKEKKAEHIDHHLVLHLKSYRNTI